MRLEVIPGGGERSTGMVQVKSQVEKYYNAITRYGEGKSVAQACVVYYMLVKRSPQGWMSYIGKLISDECTESIFNWTSDQVV